MLLSFKNFTSSISQSSVHDFTFDDLQM